MLKPGARVVEIGSYAGGFLRAATDWGWQVTGVDIGRDTARFTASLGFETSFDFRATSIDGLFIWNCFEQIADPRTLLGTAHGALREYGLLVVRVPDADLYLHWRDRHLLAANGLLGWPHRFGYGVTALRRMAEEHGFELVRVLRRPALPPLPAEEPGWIELTFQRRMVAAA
jgi:SAM-dependent methyltransferase